MNEQPGASGLILNEPLLWERGARGRVGLSIPASDVPAADIDPALVGAEVDFPDLSEVDVSVTTPACLSGTTAWTAASIRSAPAQ